jgi:flavin-dependent dehydrogenase
MMPWDAIVIGGGLAGGMAAAELSRQGKKVLLLEKEKGAHHKVCGEFISQEAQETLASLDINLIAEGAQQIHSVRLIHGDKHVSCVLPFQGMSLSRQALDELVLSKAQALGAEIMRGISAIGMSNGVSQWHVKCSDGNMYTAKTIFLATGKHDLRGWARGDGVQNGYIGFKMHFRLTSDQQEKLAGSTELILFNGGYAGLEPVENGVANLCLVVTKRRFASCGKSWDELLQAITQKTPLLAERLSGATPCWDRPLAIFGIPYGFLHRIAKDEPPGLFRIGDQMAVIPSFSGDGMAIALYTAVLAAECCKSGKAENYYDRARKLLSPQINYAAWISRILAVPSFQNLAVTICCGRPGLISAVAHRTRIRGSLKT